MKCAACEYEYQSKYARRENGKGFVSKTILGDEKFIPINSESLRRGDRESWECDKIYLYACPKCGTFRMDL